MSWFKVDDMLAFNAKVVTAGNEAMGLWVRAGSWCASQLRGGFIPSAMALAMRSPLANGSDVDALVAAGLWHEAPGGYEFHDWDEYQPSAEETAERRKKRSEAGKRGAEARWKDGNRNANANGKRIGNANGKPMPTRWQKDAPSPSPINTPGDVSPEVTELLDRLDQCIQSNGARKPKRNKGNADAMRLLLDRDHRTPEQIRRVIDWATADAFWKANILSAAKLREKFDQLLIKAGSDAAQAPRANGWMSA